MLVILPRTLPLRLALLPITLWLLFRAATLLDVTQPTGEVDPGYEFLGFGLGVSYCPSRSSPVIELVPQLTMIAAGMRVIEWAFAQKPYKRLTPDKPAPVVSNGHVNGHANGHASSLKPADEPVILTRAFWDGLDLVFNLRGIGWNWANAWYFPPETRPTSSKPAFLRATLISALKHLAVLDITLTSIRHFLPPNAGNSVGGSIYDYSLSPVRRYMKSSILSFTGGVTIYATIQMAYDVFTIISILVLQHHPSQWPTLFDSPWLSTSLGDCWAKRWHQGKFRLFGML